MITKQKKKTGILIYKFMQFSSYLKSQLVTKLKLKIKIIITHILNK